MDHLFNFTAKEVSFCVDTCRFFNKRGSCEAHNLRVEGYIIYELDDMSYVKFGGVTAQGCSENQRDTGADRATPRVSRLLSPTAAAVPRASCLGLVKKESGRKHNWHLWCWGPSPFFFGSWSPYLVLWKIAKGKMTNLELYVGFLTCKKRGSVNLTLFIIISIALTGQGASIEQLGTRASQGWGGFGGRDDRFGSTVPYLNSANVQPFKLLGDFYI